ncbi:MAG: ABC transporter ATP-binding protein [Proteobacteria bacterium]|nr:ABC transporter ATP-binding protein [Pseudomonadota bacterium]MCP4920964.1 ABC transporter ATP-binding protein [Pseudomonadota bacterium]
MSPLSRLVQHARHYNTRVAWATFFSVSNKLLDLAPPVLIGMAVDIVVEKEGSFLAGFGVPDVRDQLLVLAALTVVVWGLESITEYLQAVVWRNLAQTVQHELRLEAFEHIQELDMAWFVEQSRGGLMSVLNDDINQLERFLDGGANALLQVATTAITVSIVFFVVSWKVAALAVLPIPLIIWGSFKFQSRIAPRYLAVREHVARLNGLLSGNLGGIETIKSFSAEDREAERVRAASEAYRQANKKAISLSASFAPLIRMVIVVGFTATLLVGGWQALDGELAVGAYGMLVFLTQRLLWPLTQLGRTFDDYQRAMASTERVLDLLGTPSKILDGEGTLPAQVLGHIRFEDVDFHYPGREQLMSAFTLDVPVGATVALVGPTGSGKSTLVRMLLRLYEPQSGTITLDGVDVSEVPLAELRAQVALVGQQTFLFSGSVADNVRYGRPSASDDEVLAALTAAEALEFVSELPDGIHTRVGEEGQKLSGGQRQRLSIARAVLKDTPILVLDEATSAVDNETEAAIQRSLDRISADRTTLVIAHRLSTIRHADTIVVVEDGQLVELGTHEDLLGRGGTYARLWRVQTGVRELEEMS